MALRTPAPARNRNGASLQRVTPVGQSGDLPAALAGATEFAKGGDQRLSLWCVGA